MRPLSALALIEAWDGPEAETPHARLERLLCRSLGGEDISGDTLGRRNQRLIALRRLLCGTRPMEIAARCGCGAEHELHLPEKAIEAAAAPDPGARVTVEA